MGHDGVMSPAHRRSQNPQSPSASLFRKTSNFSRDDVDLSWTALLRRHRFLLSMLSLLAFLCTIYLYFAIKLGADSCAGLIGKELTQCQLKRSQSKSFHGHRKLLSTDDFTYGYRMQNTIRNSEEDKEMVQSKESGSGHLLDHITKGSYASGKNSLWVISEILHPGGHFIHFPDESTNVDFLSKIRLLGWSSFSRANGAVLWKK